jgi:hypothetical protein
MSSNLVIKPARVRAYLLLMTLMAIVGVLFATGLELTLVRPNGTLFTDGSSPVAMLAGTPNWWIGTACFVFGVFLFVSLPRLVFVFIDNRIAVFDERGITVRSFKLATHRVLWKELNSLNAGPLGVRLDSTRGRLSLPLVFGQTSVDEVVTIIAWFRLDLLEGQSRRFA